MNCDLLSAADGGMLEVAIRNMQTRKDNPLPLSPDENKMLEKAIIDHQVTFNQLKQLTLEDLREMGLIKIGHRKRALHAISALVASLQPMSLRSDTGNGPSPFIDLPLLSASQPSPIPISTKKTAIRQITVPVYQTLLVKKLVEDPINGQINLVGTIVQRPLYFDLALVEKDGGQHARPYFNYRFNEGSDSDETCMILRKTVRSAQKQSVKAAPTSIENGTKTSGVSGVSQAPFLVVSNTFQVNIPTVRHSVYEAHPFRIVAVELYLELSSSFGILDGDPFEFRPDFVCHVGDKRNLLSVRDWDKMGLLDEMRSFDIINTSPSVEYHIEVKQGTKDGKSAPTYYVPKMKVTWYLRSCAMQAFLESNVPILFVSLCNTLNLQFTGNYGKQFSQKYLK